MSGRRDGAILRSILAPYGARSGLSARAMPAGPKTAHNDFGRRSEGLLSEFFMSRSQIREVVMSIFSYRKHLRFLTHSQRRRWWDQKKRLTPRVKISGAYVPPNVTREFTYVKVG
ncbi:hypothetical protein [Paraburkholderia sp. BCC1885]|nr:hypothetical protein [Paraburkholderia sp. BCC1885]